MYRVLLVDDEALIREAISENTKWNELGYELAGTCKNGREAKEFIEREQVDLLLTDICMPHMDGMELTKFVYEEHREIKVVIISGYDEFEYAKKAVKYQVAEYILKPITAVELSETLLKVREKLDEERLKKENIKRIRGAYVSNLPLMRGRFLNSLLAGNVPMDTLEEKLVDYQIRLPGRRFMTAMVVADDLSPFLKEGDNFKPDLAYFAIYNITEEIMNRYQAGVTFQDVEERTILVFGGEPGMEKRVLDICEEIQSSLHKYLKMESTIAVGQPVSTLSQLYISFEDTKRALEYKFLLGGNQVIHAASLGHENKQVSAELSKYKEKIVLEIKMDRPKEIRRNVEAFIQVIRESYLSRNRCIFYVQNAILSIMNGLDTSSLNETELFQEERELLNTIYSKEHISEIGEDLISFCLHLAEGLKDQKDSYCKKQAVMAQDYIEKNYGNPDISLNSVCAHLAMSTSYCSSIFKAYTGETFIEALTKKRIEKAKSLIENTSMKTYEIAGQVGYSDPHYFSSSFKKMTGMTPTEYAKRIR